MLKALQVRNYVLIDSLDISFPEGLIIISGQTGAGKSIVLGALSLLLGAKADASVLGAGADNCVVEAVFALPESDLSLKAKLEENDIELENGELILRRVVSHSGRSRSFMNDTPVTLPVLQSVGARLVDIHSQHQTLLLTDHVFQLSLLDHFAGNVKLLEESREAYSKVRALETELSSLTSKLAALSEERDYTQSRFDKLDKANLRDGEMEELEVERKQLANAEEIKQGLFSAQQVFSASDGERVALVAALKEARRSLEKVSEYVPEAASLAGRIESSRVELADIEEEISDLNSKVEVSGDRLQDVEERLSFLYDLLRQFSASTVAELVAKREELSSKLFDSTAFEERIAAIGKELEAAKAKYDGICLRLDEARRKVSPEFSETVTASVRSLDLDHAIFSVDVSEAPASPSGKNSVTFLFSASGSKPVDVGKCASGGEMSRLMLCLKAMMARFVNMPTLVFDEIDTGVSGGAADKMGRMICSMGRDMQVFAITHLPQVAAKGDAHFLVEKEYDVMGLKASTSVRQISGDERVMEIARMLSGTEITPAAIANANVLLGK